METITRKIQQEVNDVSDSQKKLSIPMAMETIQQNYKKYQEFSNI